MKYCLGEILNLATSPRNKHHKRGDWWQNWTSFWEHTKTTKELPLAHFPEKYLYKREFSKSNAPAAAWATLSTEGIFASAFKLSLSGNNY